MAFGDFAVSADTLLLPAPSLDLETAGSNIIVSRPLLATGWSLHATTNPVVAAAWTEIPPPYQTNGANLQITEPSPAGNKFCLLHKP